MLSRRNYQSILSVDFIGGEACRIDINDNGQVRHFNFYGKEKPVNIERDAVKPDIWDREPLLRTYSYSRNDEKITIHKHSPLSNSNPSEIDTYSDLGKLLLCCDCYKILRNDSYYDVAVDDGTYTILQYDLNGRAVTDEARIIADKWFQKNRDHANIRATYKEVPKTRKPRPLSPAVPSPSSTKSSKKIRIIHIPLCRTSNHLLPPHQWIYESQRDRQSTFLHHKRCQPYSTWLFIHQRPCRPI